MAPLLFKEMKAVNFSCVSPASAAVCSSIDLRSMVRPAIIDRRLSDVRNPRRSKPYSEKSRKSLDHRLSIATRTSANASDLISPGNSSRYLLDDTAFIDVYPEPKSSVSNIDLKISPSTTSSSSSSSTNSPRILKPLKENESSPDLMRRSCVSSAHHSTVWAQSLVPMDPPKASTVLRPSNSTRSHHDQVVVLRVSLHCKGCEGKVRKHISKMEGVKSFDIDFAAKKVTVKGDITPLGVLNSVSKVKNAQFWPSPPRASASF